MQYVYRYLIKIPELIDLYELQWMNTTPLLFILFPHNIAFVFHEDKPAKCWELWWVKWVNRKEPELFIESLQIMLKTDN